VQKDKKIHMKVPLHFANADQAPGVKEQGGVVNHVLNEIDIICFPDDLPEFIEVDLSSLTVTHSIHARDLKLPKGVELALHKDENPVVATVVIPALVVEEEVAPVVSAADVPTTAQAAPGKEGEAAAGDKAGDKGGDKAPPAADKGGDKKDKK
jgi:large subunit ribosomal protein L25